MLDFRIYHPEPELSSNNRFNILFGWFSWYRNWRIPDFLRTRLNIEPYSSLKPTKVGFIFIWPNSLRLVLFLFGLTHWVEPKILQLSITWHNTSCRQRSIKSAKRSIKSAKRSIKSAKRSIKNFRYISKEFF